MYCTFFGLQWFFFFAVTALRRSAAGCHIFPLQCLQQQSHQCTVNIIFFCDEEKQGCGGWGGGMAWGGRGGFPSPPQLLCHVLKTKQFKYTV